MSKQAGVVCRRCLPLWFRRMLPNIPEYCGSAQCSGCGESPKNGLVFTAERTSVGYEAPNAAVEVLFIGGETFPGDCV